MSFHGFSGMIYASAKFIIAYKWDKIHPWDKIYPWKKIRNSSACNCALAARLAANELEQPGIRPFAAGKL